jgi:phage terminase Nu1 subunit (DNA packaging protein)
VAEFNQLSKQLKNFKEKELAIKLSEFRNERIELAKRLYNIQSSIYHIVARRNNELLLLRPIIT